jgi:hypothetical protein
MLHLFEFEDSIKETPQRDSLKSEIKFTKVAQNRVFSRLYFGTQSRYYRARIKKGNKRFMGPMFQMV